VEANKPYGLLVKYLASCWGVKLNAQCKVQVSGKTIDVTVTYMKPGWTPDAGYCTKEVTCQLPALAAGDYVLGPGSSCTPPAVVIHVKSATSGAATCFKTSC
jgi:hypothetical protein